MNIFFFDKLLFGRFSIGSLLLIVIAIVFAMAMTLMEDRRRQLKIAISTVIILIFYTALNSISAFCHRPLSTGYVFGGLVTGITALILLAGIFRVIKLTGADKTSRKGEGGKP